MKRVYLISNIEEYGKLISFCINNDIQVWRTYWDEREKGDRCYQIDWQQKRCYYSSKRYYVDSGYQIVIPKFELDEYGNYKIKAVKDFYDLDGEKPEHISQKQWDTLREVFDKIYNDEE